MKFETQRPKNNQKVIVLMTDDDNYCQGDQEVIRQCEILRKKGVTVLAAQFANWSQTRDFFLRCAGDEKYVVDANSEEGMFKAFTLGIFGSEKSPSLIH